MQGVVRSIYVDQVLPSDGAVLRYRWVGAWRFARCVEVGLDAHSGAFDLKHDMAINHPLCPA